MLIDFQEAKRQEFIAVAEKIMANPELYLGFSHVAEFYAATWLAEFPQGSTWHTTGLDDGAEQFYAVICYQQLRFAIDIGAEIQLQLSQTAL